jgi:hypothetical protein
VMLEVLYLKQILLLDFEVFIYEKLYQFEVVEHL